MERAIFDPDPILSILSKEAVKLLYIFEEDFELNR